MTEERRIQLVAEVNTTQTREGFNEISQQATTMAESVARSGGQAEQAVSDIGSGADRSARTVESAQRNLIGSIQRTTASMEAGSRSSSQYYEVLARQRGVDPSILAPYLEQLRAIEAAQASAAQAIQETAPAVDSLGTSAAQTANALRGVPAQFTDIITSIQGGQNPLTVFMQQGGQLRDTFGSAGAAARGLATYVASLVNPLTVAGAAAAALGAAYYLGSQETDAYNRALILTGNVAGTTSDQLAGMAKEIAKITGVQGDAAQALAALAGAGNISVDNLKRFGAASVRAQKEIGVSIDDTTASFVQLGEAPLQASEKLNEQYHYLTASVYAQIKALQDQGKTEEAGATAQTAFADALESRASKMTANLGTVEKAWRGITGAAKSSWDAMLDVGREDTLEQKLEKVRSRIAKGQKAFDASVGGNSEDRMSLKKNQAEEQSLLKQIDANARLAVIEGARAKLDEDSITWQKEGEQYLSRRVQMERDVAKAREQGLAAGASDTEINARVLEVQKKYSDIFNDAIDSQIEAIKRRGVVEDIVTKRSMDLLTTSKAAGLVNEKDYIEAVAALNMAEFAKQKSRLQDELGLTAKKQNSRTAQAALIGQIEQVEENALSRKLQLSNELFALDVKSTRQAANSYADLFDKRDADLQSLLKQVRAQRDLNNVIGLSKKDAAAYNATLVEETSIRKEVEAAILDTIMGREEEANKLRESAAAMRELSAAQRIGAAKAFDFEGQKKLWESIDQTAHDTFVSIFDSGKSAFDRLRDTLKNGLLDMLYQMTVKRWIFSIGAEVSGYSGIAQTAAGAIGGGQGGIGSMSTLSSLGALSSSSSYLGQFASGYSGSAAAASQALGAPMTTSAQLGSYTGAAAPYLAGAGGGLAAYTYGEKYGAAGGLAAGAGTIAAGGAASAAIGGTSIAAGATAALAAIPVWGWAALAAMAIVGGMQDGPEEHTRLQFASNNAVGNINNNERGESWAAPYIGNGSTSALGTFGVRSTFWMDPNQDAVQSFLKTVGQTDDALASFMTATEKASVTSYLTGKTYTANTGAEGTNPNANGELDKVFADRITNILEGIEPGLSKLEIGFAGTSQELATEASALLSFRAALKESGETVFGAKVTLQEIAALKLPTETTSAALARVTAEFNITSQVAQLLGKDVSKAFGATGLASEAARAQLIQLSGGMATFTAQASAYAQTYLTDEERNKVLVKQVTEQMSALGLASITTKDQFKALVMGLDLSSEADAKRYAALMKVSGDFATAADATAAAIAKAQEAAKATAGLDGQIYDLTHTAAEALARQRQVELAAMTATDAALQKRIYALTDEAQAQEAIVSARGTLQEAYDRESSSLKSVIGLKTAEAAATRKQIDALKLGTLSTLSPEAKLAEAQRQFDTATGAGKDAAATPYLEALKGYYGSTKGYADGYAKVQAALVVSAASASSEATVAQQQLTKMDKQVSGLLDINKSVVGVEQAVYSLGATLRSGTAAQSVVGELSQTGVIEGIYRSVLGRGSDAGGLEYWKGQAQSLSLDEMIRQFRVSPEYLRSHSHANGGIASDWSLVGEEGAEWVNFTSPGRVYTASESRSMMGGVDNSAEIKRQTAAIERQNTLIERQNVLLEEIAGSTEDGASSEDIRALKQHMAKVLSQKATA